MVQVVCVQLVRITDIYFTAASSQTFKNLAAAIHSIRVNMP